MSSYSADGADRSHRVVPQVTSFVDLDPTTPVGCSRRPGPNPGTSIPSRAAKGVTAGSARPGRSAGRRGANGARRSGGGVPPCRRAPRSRQERSKPLSCDDLRQPPADAAQAQAAAVSELMPRRRSRP